MTTQVAPVRNFTYYFFSHRGDVFLERVGVNFRVLHSNPLYIPNKKITVPRSWFFPECTGEWTEAIITELYTDDSKPDTYRVYLKPLELDTVFDNSIDFDGDEWLDRQ